MTDARDRVRLGEPAGRWVLAATVLGSAMAMIDGTVVNVALPAIGRGLHATLGDLQWTVTAYILTLAALILFGGSLGDRYGRRRVFVTGVAWFALASALCGLATDPLMLIAARVLQGVGGALLVPGSLAIIQSSFAARDRPRAVGAWSGLGGVAAAAGPLLGGTIVDAIGWRWVFLLNLPLAVVVIAIARRHVPETRDTSLDGGAAGGFDVAGAVLAALALAGITYALIEAPAHSSGGGLAGRPAGLIAGVAGLAAGVAFVALERRRGRLAERFAGRVAPMLPLSVFGSRQFAGVNVVTFIVYGAFSGMLFLLPLQLQLVSGFSALGAGTALLPTTLLMLALSARSGALAQRVGPRWLMAGGGTLCAAGMGLLVRVGPHAAYVSDVLPAVAVFGLGLTMLVAPLTATVLASADERHAGLASGVNNAVARAASLLAVAGLPAAVGLSAAGYHDPAAFDSGFRTAMLACAGLMLAGAVLSAALIDNSVLAGSAVAADDAAGQAAAGAAAPGPGHSPAGRAAARSDRTPECRTSCALSAPPLEGHRPAAAGQAGR